MAQTRGGGLTWKCYSRLGNSRLLRFLLHRSAVGKIQIAGRKTSIAMIMAGLRVSGPQAARLRYVDGVGLEFALGVVGVDSDLRGTVFMMKHA